MPDRAQLLQLLYDAVDELNVRTPAAARLPKSEQAAIAGDGSTLESLDYINLVVDFERRLSEALARPAALAERLVLEESDGPPSTLGALVDLAAKVVAETG